MRPNGSKLLTSGERLRAIAIFTQNKESIICIYLEVGGLLPDHCINVQLSALFSWPTFILLKLNSKSSQLQRNGPF
jgi:hypothetical protein